MSLKTQMQTVGERMRNIYTSSTPHPQHSIEWWWSNVCQGTKSQLNCVITCDAGGDDDINSLYVSVASYSLEKCFRRILPRIANWVSPSLFSSRSVCLCVSINLYRIRSRIHPQNRSVHTRTHTNTSNICTNHTQHKQECQRAWTVNTIDDFTIAIRFVPNKLLTRARKWAHTYIQRIWPWFSKQQQQQHHHHHRRIALSSRIIRPVGECRHRHRHQKRHQCLESADGFNMPNTLCVWVWMKHAANWHIVWTHGTITYLHNSLCEWFGMVYVYVI